MLSFILILVILLIGIPTGCFLLYKWLNNKGWSKSARIIPSLILGGFICIWYDAAYPNDDFYEQEFTTVTALPFPESGEVLRKSASYPDQHGDYASCAQIKISQRDFDNLLQHFKKDSSYVFNSNQFVGSDEFSYITKKAQLESFAEKFSKGNVIIGAYVFIGFLHDRETIIIYRRSS